MQTGISEPQPIIRSIPNCFYDRDILFIVITNSIHYILEKKMIKCKKKKFIYEQILAGHNTQRN